LFLVIDPQQPNMSFFGFDSALPERRDLPGQAGQGQAGFGFQGNTANQAFGAGEDEDLAVYTWGQDNGASLLEGGDDMNDETFGDVGPISESSLGTSHALKLLLGD
jgi:DNA topoisomerase 2-associated protein PAT1